MKAAVMHQYGRPEVLHYEELPNPVIQPGEVLVHVAATSVNPFDLKIRSGAVKEWVPLTFPAILGLDVSGTVEDVGPGVTGFAYGDKVFAHTIQTYASHCVVKAQELAKIPEGLDLIDAAALPTVTTTGAQLAALALKQGTGETVLITGAVGNVGRSAMCIAKERGATVIAGVLKRQAVDALAAGADWVVALDDQNVVGALQLVDSVADTIGGPIAAKLITKVKPGGIFASVLGAPTAAAANPQVQVKTMQVKADPVTQLRMAYAVVEGRLAIPIGERFEMKDAAKAHTAAETGAPGKLLLLP
jgi:NADPH:quinone reductase-like Zn-dependent oxidoreductase